MQSTCWRTWITDTRRQVEAFTKSYQKSDAQVILEVEHIVTSSGMDFPDDYKIIKDNIILSGKHLQKKPSITSRTKLQFSRKKLKIASSHSKISSISMTGPSRKSYEKLMCKNSKKLSEELLLKSRTKYSATCPSVQLRCLKKTWNGWD